MSGDLLLTGATGFVGMEVLGRYLEHSDRRIIAPLRAPDDHAAGERLRAVLHGLFGERGREFVHRVEPMAADLTAPQLGLSPARRDEVAARVDQIIHSAASVSFALPLAESRATNLEGTRRMLELADVAQAMGGISRYTQISTAFVAGTHTGRFSEQDHALGQSFHNAYEQSKHEAEALVRARADLPTTILRPSIVVGDRQTGWTHTFNVLYFPIRAFAMGLLPAMPAIPTAPVDAVSVDFVADGIYTVCESSEGIGETFHLTASEHASSVAEIVELASHYFDRPPPHVLEPAEFAEYAKTLSETKIAALAQGAIYFPYFTIDTVFDDQRSRDLLAPAGIAASPLRDYMSRLLDFATTTRWGKRPVSRGESLAMA